MDIGEIYISQVMKNNGVVLDTLNIVRKGEEHYPMIYLNDYYQQYLDTSSMEDILVHLSGLLSEQYDPGL